MAEVTLNIPDPIYKTIEKRAKDTNNPNGPQGVIIANLALIFGAAQYTPEKWLKNQTSKDDMSQPW
ncbi:MAG: hypothetical protein GKS04_03170 [Candidatus Mycalebacterium zealandia]|nr:MAG: hypothetical protein GKS04_03170 [Candidatus Mycalebacterium zealandia]